MMHKINSILFVLLVLSIGFFNIFFHTENAVSELENKELQLFPDITLKAIFEDRVTNKIDSFVSDQFMFRTPLIKLSSSISSLSGFKSDMTISVVANDNMISNFAQDTSRNKSNSSTNTVDNQTFEVGDIDVNYLVFEDRAFACFDENQKVEHEYSDAINSLSNRFENVNFSVLLTPTQVAFLDKSYDGLTDNQVDSLNRFETLFESKIKYVNAYNLLKKNYSDDLFFRTDHHWNGLGAYYGYLSYCEAKSLQPLLRKDTVYGEVNGFLGSVYKMMNNQNLAKHPDKIMTYTPKINVSMDRYKVVGDQTVLDISDIPYLISEKLMGGSPSYRVFLGGDCAMTVVRNLNDTSLPKLLVVKDSYGNALVPFLSANYSEIYAVDPRHYVGDLTKLIDEKEIKEVLFINSANITRTSGYADMILKAFE